VKLGPDISVPAALQAAEILLMMRPDTEVPSDFQDYTLVALIGVAVHLSGASPSEPAVLPTLVSGLPNPSPDPATAGFPLQCSFVLWACTVAGLGDFTGLEHQSFVITASQGANVCREHMCMQQWSVC
jgi:hypothetical protein